MPVQYAKKVIHNRVYGGTQTLPVRVDTGGVMPPILASSLPLRQQPSQILLQMKELSPI